MADKVWIGTDSGNEGDWATAANWDGGVPVNGDDVYFVSGSQDVLEGVAQGAVTLDSLNFGTKYTGNVNANASGVSQALVINATVLDYASQIGALKIDGTLTTVNVQTTSIDSPALELSACNTVTLRITGGRGTILLSDATDITTTIDMIGAKSVRVEVESGCDVGDADLIIDDGRFVTYEETGNITQYGGRVEFIAAAGTTPLITIYQGNFKYKPTGATILTSLIMYGGFFDMRGCTAPSHTITSIILYSGAFIDERNGLNNAIYTTPLTMNGGIIKCDMSREITVA